MTIFVFETDKNGNRHNWTAHDTDTLYREIRTRLDNAEPNQKHGYSIHDSFNHLITHIGNNGIQTDGLTPKVLKVELGRQYYVDSMDSDGAGSCRCFDNKAEVELDQYEYWTHAYAYNLSVCKFFVFEREAKNHIQDTCGNEWVYHDMMVNAGLSGPKMVEKAMISPSAFIKAAEEPMTIEELVMLDNLLKDLSLLRNLKLNEYRGKLAIFNSKLSRKLKADMENLIITDVSGYFVETIGDDRRVLGLMPNEPSTWRGLQADVDEEEEASRLAEQGGTSTEWAKSMGIEVQTY